MKIGITQRILSYNGFDYDSLEPCWYDLFDEHEIIPIPNNVNLKEELYSNIDLLILSGGDDSVTRRIVETRLISFMMSNNKPIIGICHGAFLLTQLFDGVVEESNDSIHRNEHVLNSGILVNSHHNLVITEQPENTLVLHKHNDCVECWVHDYLKIGAIVWHPERMKEPFIPKELLKFIE